MTEALEAAIKQETNYTYPNKKCANCRYFGDGVEEKTCDAHEPLLGSFPVSEESVCDLFKEANAEVARPKR